MKYAVVMMRRSWRNSGQICPIAHALQECCCHLPLDSSSSLPLHHHDHHNVCEVAAIEYVHDARFFWIDSSIGLAKLSLSLSLF